MVILLPVLVPVLGACHRALCLVLCALCSVQPDTGHAAPLPLAHTRSLRPRTHAHKLTITALENCRQVFVAALTGKISKETDHLLKQICRDPVADVAIINKNPLVLSAACVQVPKP